MKVFVKLLWRMVAFDNENDPREMIQSLSLAIRTSGHPLLRLLRTNFSSPEMQFLFIMLGIRVNICTPVHCKSELFHNCFLIIALCKTLSGTNSIISQICLLYTNVIKSEASLIKSDMN